MKLMEGSYHKIYRLILVLSICMFAPILANAQDIDGVDVSDDDTLVSDLDLSVDSIMTAADSSLLWPDNVCERLNHLLENDIFERTQVGLYVYDLTSDSAIFAHGHRQQLRPASSLKLMTAITALAQLGGSYRFETQLYHTGTVENDTVLNGDLYIVGGMDPRFGSDDMKAFVEAISELGVKRIDGNIYVDVSMKDTLMWGNGWCWDDELERLTPLLYNGKDRFMKEFFRMLGESGIENNGSFEIRRLPNSAQLMAGRFHTMDQILMRMLKKSDNQYAESMFYQLGRQSGGKYPSWKESSRKVKEFIRSIGLDPSIYRIADGSGLSLYSYITPELLVMALRYAYSRNNIYLHLYPALPIAGVDGTLSKRMRNGWAYENVHAKTGTVEGVSSLAGYATAANGHVLAFAIMNQGIIHTSTGKNFQDRVCQALTKP